ncbi:MAG TPA: CcmD family protein [Bacteroidota bacterium]|nr:CcmD family protein [Bacteroidota bacterium]
MYEFLSHNQLYVVLTVTLLIWAGIVFYLLRLDRKLSILERELKRIER